MFRLALGFFATLAQASFGLFFFFMQTPPNYPLNVRFLGEFMLVVAAVLFLMTMWYNETRYQPAKPVAQ